jgi:hypothetical protein
MYAHILVLVIALTSGAGPTDNPAAVHWAFQPVKQVELPAGPNDAWSANAIDRFVLAAQCRVGLAPSPPADRRTRLRRATFDLTGLPPTPEEIAAFEADRSPDAWRSQVDRLLASPRYGERWGRHWLDVARYADNKGYVFFEEKNYPWAWAYRDYVVRSFNEDKPYDRFIVEQLAADLLAGDRPDGDNRTLAALGFLTVGPHFMNNVHDIIDDRIDVITRGLMGLTATCARCHDHKYDPIPQGDYYSLYGVLRSCTEPLVPPLLDRPPATDAYRRFAGELAVRQARLDDFVWQKHTALVLDARARVADYLLAAHAARGQPATDDFMLLADPGDLNPMMTTRWRSYLERTEQTRHPVWMAWHRLAALPAERFGERAAARIDELAGDPSVPANPLVLRALKQKPPQSVAELAARYADLLHAVDAAWQREQGWAAARKQPLPTALPDPAAEQLRLVLYGREAPPDVPLVSGWGFLDLLPDRAAQAEYQKRIKDVETWAASGPGAPPRAMLLADSDIHEPHIFLRGNPNRPGPAVPRQFLAVAAPERTPFRQGSGRLELAHAVASPRNPLTARVIVNRVWMHHFGSGLVRTPSDFGLRSEPPSHPELLDYLASELSEHGWSLKALHRLIMTSATYQQQSLDGSEGLSRDPENRWLWKMNRRRLDFESTRDALLVATGQLAPQLGGPPQDLLSGGLQHRRTLYTYIDRQDVPGLFTVFDFPSPSTSCPQRETTTVPPQALFLMNHPLAAESATRILQRGDVASRSDRRARCDRLGLILFGRHLTANEHELAAQFLGDDPKPELWHQFTHALLLTNEFVFVD